MPNVLDLCLVQPSRVGFHVPFGEQNKDHSFLFKGLNKNSRMASDFIFEFVGFSGQRPIVGGLAVPIDVSTSTMATDTIELRI